MRKRDLVYLVYAQNECYVRVTDQAPKNIKVDVEKRTYLWPYSENGHRSTVELKIGNGRAHYHARSGALIGVFDRTNTDHLDSMVSSARDATQPQGGIIHD